MTKTAMNQPPVGTYADVTGVVDTTAQTEITALLTTLKDMIKPQTETANDTMGVPFFAMIDAPLAAALITEINGIGTAIAAAPDS